MRFFDRRLNPTDSGTGNFTGDIKSSIKTASHGKWVLLNGDTIGSAASGATLASEIYRELYREFYDSMADAQAPVSTGRGANADADFDADKTLTMPDGRGRTLRGTGTGAGLTARTHGDTSGVEDTIVPDHTHTDTLAVPDHTHPSGTLDVDLILGGSGSDDLPALNAAGNVGGGTAAIDGATDVTGSTGTQSTNVLTGSIDNAGVSVTDENASPWLAANWFIRY